MIKCANQLTRKLITCNRPKTELKEEALPKMSIPTQTKAPMFQIQQIREFRAVSLKRISRTITGGYNRLILLTNFPDHKRNRSLVKANLAKCNRRPTPQCLPRVLRGAKSISSRRNISTWLYPKILEV